MSARALPVLPFDTHAYFQERQSNEKDREFKRDEPNATKQMWDSNIEDLDTRMDARKGGQPGHVNNSSRRSHPSTEPRSEPRKPDVVDEWLNAAEPQEKPSPSDNDSSLGEELPEGLVLQPGTRPISHEQLVIEVKGIYAGLVMVEAKCMDIDERQSTAAQEKSPVETVNLKNDQWQSLIALHKQLLYEHHDFFLASQHPSASPALTRLAAKYSMPARMWRHGIHAFLEILRHRLPGSLEHMLAFIYIAYSMMALLYETVSTFEDTWIECLGDLGRYRMAIEDDEPKDREVWSNVARFWYNKAADKSPNVGRLYHHLAIFARPGTIEQLSLYTRSLTCVTPFENAKGSITTLLNPICESMSTAAQEKDQTRKVNLDQLQSVIRQLLQGHDHEFLASHYAPVRSALRHVNKAAKIKRGLPGLVNGSKISALADTGAAQNIVSAAFAQERRLKIKENPALFRLGNSKIAQSVGKTYSNIPDDMNLVVQVILDRIWTDKSLIAGTVNLQWAFAEKPKEVIDIICHVLPQCAYDLILGSKFLKATETLSKHRRRLVECVFSVFNVFHLSFLDGGRQTLDGKVGGRQIFAVPDTGAERNVMDSDYAEALGFKINARPENRGFLQFADGTSQETVGQVDTTWTFASGLTVPLTFEVLENCSADVILGEDILWEHDVFQLHAASIQEMQYENEADEMFDLAPFSYEKRWQRKAHDVKYKILSKFNKYTHKEESLDDEALEQQYEAEERQRRDHWNQQYGFEGAYASPAEREAEARRKRRYDARLEAFRRRGPCPERSALLISNPPAATNNAHVDPSAISPESRGTFPIIPSIPTARNDAPVYLAATDARRITPVMSRSTAAIPTDNAPSSAAAIDQVRRGLRF